MSARTHDVPLPIVPALEIRDMSAAEVHLRLVRSVVMRALLLAATAAFVAAGRDNDIAGVRLVSSENALLPVLALMILASLSIVTLLPLPRRVPREIAKR